MSSPLLPNVTDSVHVFGLPAARLPPVYTDYQLHEQLINRVRASAASTDGNESGRYTISVYLVLGSKHVVDNRRREC